MTEERETVEVPIPDKGNRYLVMIQDQVDIGCKTLQFIELKDDRALMNWCQETADVLSLIWNPEKADEVRQKHPGVV